jgi:hypothetical protein
MASADEMIKLIFDEFCNKHPKAVAPTKESIRMKTHQIQDIMEGIADDMISKSTIFDQLHSRGYSFEFDKMENDFVWLVEGN